MNLFFIKLCLLLFCFAAPCCGMAQPTFVANIQPKIINLNEQVTLTLRVNNCTDLKEITPPNFTDFVIINGPVQTRLPHDVHGDETYTVTLKYILRPKKTGQILLNNSTAIVGSTILKADEIWLTVLNKDTKNTVANIGSSLTVHDDVLQKEATIATTEYILQKGENAQNKIKKNMQLLLHINKNTCYVGEPVCASYTLYTRLPTESAISKNPSFNGFSVIDMIDQNRSIVAGEAVLNGRKYQTYTLRKAQLFPQLPGIIEVGQAEINNAVSIIPSTTNDVYTNPIVENVLLCNEPNFVKVKPLPTYNVPAYFAGAVGNFDMDVALKNNPISTNQTGLMLITIKGQGNLHLITAPHINWPIDVEVFEPNLTNTINNSTFPISGSIVFQIPFAVSKVGEHTTPDIFFSYFNPTTGKYISLKKTGLAFTVYKPIDNNTGVIVKKNNTPSVADGGKIVTQNMLFIFLAVIILIALSILFYFKNTKKPSVENIINTTISPQATPNTTINSSIHYLEKSAYCLQNNTQANFYAMLLIELKYFLSIKFSLPTANLPMAAIALAMEKQGVQHALIVETKLLIAQLEKQLYTPSEKVEQKEIWYANACTLVEKIKLV